MGEEGVGSVGILVSLWRIGHLNGIHLGLYFHLVDCGISGDETASQIDFDRYTNSGDTVNGHERDGLIGLWDLLIPGPCVRIEHNGEELVAGEIECDVGAGLDQSVLVIVCCTEMLNVP